jgi:hypothetical protein
LTAIATPPTPAAAERIELLEQMWEGRPGLLGWLTTTDHKRIGLLYFWTTLALFGAGGIEALIMRTQLAEPNQHLVSPNTYDELFTVHGITMIFFFIIPMTTGAFGNYLLPLMIGARDMAFPRMNALSWASGRTPAGSTTSRSRAVSTTQAATSTSTASRSSSTASRRASPPHSSSSRSSSRARPACRSTACPSSATRSSRQRPACWSPCRC